MLTPFVHGNIKTVESLLRTFKATLVYSDALYFSTMTKSLDAFSCLSIVGGSRGDQGRISDGGQSHPCLLCLQPRRRNKVHLFWKNLVLAWEVPQATTDAKNNSGEKYFQGKNNYFVLFCFLTRIVSGLLHKLQALFYDDYSSLSLRSHHKPSGCCEKAERSNHSVARCVCTCASYL